MSRDTWMWIRGIRGELGLEPLTLGLIDDYPTYWGTVTPYKLIKTVWNTFWIRMDSLVFSLSLLARSSCLCLPLSLSTLWGVSCSGPGHAQPSINTSLYMSHIQPPTHQHTRVQHTQNTDFPSNWQAVCSTSSLKTPVKSTLTLPLCLSLSLSHTLTHTHTAKHFTKCSCTDTAPCLMVAGCWDSGI